MDLASMNVRALLDNANQDRPDIQIALVLDLIAKELSRFKVDISTFSEARLADNGDWR